MTQNLFPLGKLVATPGVLDALLEVQEIPTTYVWRHLAGDWGDLDAEDKASNNDALKTGERILSAYNLKNGKRIWIITEADRSSTCILLPEEY